MFEDGRKCLADHAGILRKLIKLFMNSSLAGDGSGSKDSNRDAFSSHEQGEKKPSLPVPASVALFN